MGRRPCDKPGHTPRADGRCSQCIKAGQMRHYRANVPGYKERASKWARDNRVRRTAIIQRNIYGWNPPPKPAWCDCCKKRRPRCIDHDHTTGAFRGWLCFKCNTGIGQLGDTVDGVLGAVGYLLRAAGLCS